MTRLEQLRIDAQLTTKELSEAAKVQRRTILRLEAGNGARLETLAALGAFFGVPASDLVREALPVVDRRAA